MCHLDPSKDVNVSRCFGCVLMGCMVVRVMYCGSPAGVSLDGAAFGNTSGSLHTVISNDGLFDGVRACVRDVVYQIIFRTSAQI